MSKPNDEQLDDFFKSIDDNLESLADFSQNIKQKLDDSLQKSGYASWSEMFEKGLDSLTRQVSPLSGQTDFNAPKAIVCVIGGLFGTAISLRCTNMPVSYWKAIWIHIICAISCMEKYKDRRKIVHIAAIVIRRVINKL